MTTLQIPVKHIDTTKYIVNVAPDLDAYDGPDSWGNYTIVQFRDRDFTTYVNPYADNEYFTDSGKLTPAISAKLRAGKMFTFSYHRYSSTDGGFYRFDGAITGNVDTIDGFIVFDDEYIKGASYEERRRYAESDLREYTEWANGEVYGVSIETNTGLEIDACSGFIGEDAVIAYINETIPDALPENIERRFCNE